MRSSKSVRKSHLQGYLYVLTGAALWGISSVVAKSLFNTGLAPIKLVSVRLTLTTVSLFVVLLFSDRKRILIAARDLPYFLILGFVGVAGMQFTYYDAMSRIHVAVAILLQYLQPLWVSSYAFLFQKEPITRGKITALVLSLAGSYFVVGGHRLDLLRSNAGGILSGLCASFFFAFYALWGERGLKKYDPWTILLYGLGFGSLFYFFVDSPVRIVTAGYPLKVWMAFIFIAVFSTLIPYGFYFKGVERIRATRASITSTLEPVVAGFAAYLVLGEELHPVQILGGCVVLTAIVLLQISREGSAPASPLDVRRAQRETINDRQ
jgi:drug/metabolite transporter, DME family